MGEKLISIEVAYAMPDEQKIIGVQVDEVSNIEQAITQSGILNQYPEIDLKKFKVGIFGKVLPKDHQLKLGDRVEIYRPLICDPKEARRLRAAGKTA